MAGTTPRAECDERETLVDRQSRRLEGLLDAIRGRSPFYTRKLESAGVATNRLHVPEDLPALPLTTKAELVADQGAHPPWGSVLSEPLDRYTRYNQTSSTTGRPLRWPDTNESWQWMLECWKAVYRAAHVGPEDRLLFAFSFGPFLGFWTAFDAACQIGSLAVPAGGMSSQQRLALVDAIQPTIVCCTPTYALRLAEVAAERVGAKPLSEAGVRAVIVAGEPGGSIPATRARIEQAWGARVIDQHGLTEVGPVSFECWEGPGFLHVNENEFICEVLNPSTLAPVPDGQPGELVLTNLGRTASPVIRYRTGDVVIRRLGACPCGRSFARLEGGIIARTDDMVNIRGVNVYPTAIESVVRGMPEIVEFRSTVSHTGTLRSLSLEIEMAPAADGSGVAQRLSQQLREALGLTIAVHVAAPGTLPRFEMKARRFVVQT
ncbi:MAG: CoF synthetase [Blastocatellia bacterium]|nr:MAG: CoF synthetase [Blastocatellia bacterium]